MDVGQLFPLGTADPVSGLLGSLGVNDKPPSSRVRPC